MQALTVVGKSGRTAKGAKSATTQPSKLAKPSKRQQERATNHAWAHRGIGVCVISSAILNAVANYHASINAGRYAWVGAILLGVMIPCLVYILARVAGVQYTMRAYYLAGFTACMGVGLLGLSIHHCGDAISMLTGMGTIEGVLMAIAIDGGLVACELETLRK